MDRDESNGAKRKVYMYQGLQMDRCCCFDLDSVNIECVCKREKESNIFIGLKKDLFGYFRDDTCFGLL